ncbi:LLM class flavin-dependent oxidoreductase [Nocardioides soli]|uniref:Alkanesulfonate monooxygenase SsuD/methylene tetrahydromethanopterin reductase-like flavin-dependent oxidoreductase (Luciferase family) n=1 Tax=Nocardioides soli TaxID=1036020 RepID=A0A7W4W0Z7_9ACTN|nr:LLM class flavin-dependent oxidoreductase [Nocardioides soli]MBB3044907.1 alkanesulfonate monooxygenase SsuD/methylene tetrahydromethanopterin reductase-like flavin-dependent oxidoreductase (luciferase family) [Nocardioides soli]
MTDYGHDLLFGTFVTPSAQGAGHVLDLAVAADRAGLDLVTFQDHPYQSAFLDTWTLLAYAAARTERIHLAGNVLNLPLRPPALLARAAASLDVLSGGRLELGLGSGAFWDGIEAMGGRRLTPAEGVRALREGIGVIREVWDTDTKGGVHHRGEFYTVDGAKRGPRPAHEIGIWVGAYKPKMLELTGAVADGWLPSMSYLPDGADSLPGLNARIDDAAVAAGRAPRDVRRLLNFMDAGPASSADWAEQLADLALTHGISGFIVGGDDLATTERLAAEVAPAVREIVSKER